MGAIAPTGAGGRPAMRQPGGKSGSSTSVRKKSLICRTASVKRWKSTGLLT
jgi:hypothetical protein